MSGKGQVRERGKVARRSMDEAARAAASAAIRRAALALPELAGAGTVLCYLSKSEEVDTGPLVDALLGRGLRVAVPLDGEEPALSLIGGRGELSRGRRGVPEPPLEAVSPVDLDEVDLAFVPGIAFDLSGRRVGHGGGYFDRVIAGLREDAIVFGLAFSCQVFPWVPEGEHDERVDGLVTERGVWRFPRPGRSARGGRGGCV